MSLKAKLFATKFPFAVRNFRAPVSEQRIFHVVAMPLTLNFLCGHMRAAHAAGYDVHAVSGPDVTGSSKALPHYVTLHELALARTPAILADLGALFRLWSLFRRARPSIVQGHTPKAALLAMMAAWAACVPVRIYHAHGPPPTSGRIGHTLLRRAEQLTVMFSTGVIAVSPSLRSEMVRTGIARHEQITVFRRGSVSGVDALGYFNPHLIATAEAMHVRSAIGVDDAPLVGFVGRVVPDKGISDLVAAMQFVREVYPNAQLLIVGDMEKQHPLDRYYQTKLDASEWVHIVGWQADLRPYYLAMDVLALPSRREGFGMVLLEAAAMGRPVIATRITGCVDAVAPGETGLLVEAGSPRALSQCLVTLISDPGLRRRLGEAGRARVLRDFRPHEIELDLLSYYELLS
jgi:glycosyltransferase involved in cell wall biosynthesis